MGVASSGIIEPFESALELIFHRRSRGFRIWTQKGVGYLFVSQIPGAFRPSVKRWPEPSIAFVLSFSFLVSGRLIKISDDSRSILNFPLWFRLVSRASFFELERRDFELVISLVLNFLSRFEMPRLSPLSFFPVEVFLQWSEFRLSQIITYCAFWGQSR